GDPQRFCYLGPYRREDFFVEKGRVREPNDVNATLASQRDLQLTPKPQQHREILLTGNGERGAGLGIVSLRDPDKFHHFRETLKNLLMLKDISQGQMRDSLLMLADIPTEQAALEKRVVLGEDHDRLVSWPRAQRTSRPEGAILELFGHAVRVESADAADDLNREESKDVVLCPVGPARARVGRIALERAEFGHSGVRRKDGRILGGEEVVDLGLGVEVEDPQLAATVAIRGA